MLEGSKEKLQKVCVLKGFKSEQSVLTAVYLFFILEDLSEHFGQFGEIENINVKVDAATGRARGFAFIVYKTMEGLDNVSIICLIIYLLTSS